MEGTVETRAQIAYLHADGIFRVRAKAGTDLTLVEAREIIKKMGSLSGGQPRPALVDATGTKSIDREARRYFAGHETAKVESAAALIIGSPLSRAIGNFFMGLNKAQIPVRLFTSEDEALEWLRGFRT